MDSRYKIEISTFKKIGGNKYHLIFQIENTELDYNVNIIDGDGVFGVEMPDELGLLLHEFPMSHKEVVNSVKNEYKKIFADRQLQAA
ncbi:MAG: hypothetical protein M3Q99_09515 [Acidobacteriota bacterium]|nr:hypothetical protein [Acidobacteriota bacterium]